MKKILLSVSVIAVVAVVVIGVTTAFFSDTETSTGNTFTAGSLDLILNKVETTNRTPVTGPLFTFDDMKPGDTGEKTLELKIIDNPACGFAFVDLTSDLENSCTEPESGVETDCAVPGNGGELNNAIDFMIWEDTDCDNEFDINNPEERVIAHGPLTANMSYALG
jgi:predicted ribosomally synthesized peptide with SipW-like signal peptide